MSTSLYEVIELENGEIGLRRAGENGEPLIRIKFSSDTEHQLGLARLEIAKVMLEAGLEVLEEMMEEVEDDEPTLSPESRILH